MMLDKEKYYNYLNSLMGGYYFDKDGNVVSRPMNNFKPVITNIEDAQDTENLYIKRNLQEVANNKLKTVQATPTLGNVNRMFIKMNKPELEEKVDNKESLTDDSPFNPYIEDKEDLEKKIEREQRENEEEEKLEEYENSDEESVENFSNKLNNILKSRGII